MIRFKNIELSYIIIIVCVWFAALVSLWQDSVNQKALYFVLPFAFLLSFFKNGGMKTNKYMKVLIVLYIWIFVSVSWATNTELALRQMQQILGAFILCYILSTVGKKIDLIAFLYITYFIILIGDWYYAYNNIFNVIDVGVDRMDDQKLNANSFAYHTFYATFAAYILGEISNGFKKKLSQILFLITIPLSFITALYTASRQVLLIQAPLIAILLYLRYLKHTSKLRKLIFGFIFLITIVGVGNYVYNTYEDSTLKQRSEKNLEDDSRTKLAEDAFKVSVEHFPLGVGANNYIIYSYNKHFSHNTYVELLANEGFVGLFLYLYLLLGYMKRQYKRYKRSKDKMFLSFMFFGIFYMIDGFFYAFYSQIWLISFFILVATHSETYYKNKYINYAN